MDLFLILCVCVAFIAGWSHWMRRKSKKEVADNSRAGFHVEHPRRSGDKDLLGRLEEAEALAEKIFQANTSRGAFTLGLTSPWGAGKTSFMLVMKEYLERQHDEKTIVVEFNPWRYRKAPNLTIFFEELSRALAPYNSALSTGFVRYVDLLLAKDSNPWLQLASRFLPHESNAKSTGEQYDFLTREISKLGRKIFIFIDDVDRLEREELVELFALVRNSSSFPCMSYILVYDKEYVASQLKGCFDQHTHRYMEKIVQVEYALAQITPEQIERALKLELERMGHRDLWGTLVTSRIQISHHLPTIRAVKRICNTLSSSRRVLEGNILPFDCFFVELIRIQYPRLFDFLRENYALSFESQGDKLFFDAASGMDDKEAQINLAWVDHPIYGKRIDLGKYILENKQLLQVNRVALVAELIEQLWRKSRKAEPLQANHRDYIGRYFYRTLREVEIDETEFRAHIVLPFEEIIPYLRTKAVCQFTDLVRKVRREPIENQEQARKYLQVLFYLLSDLDRIFERDEITDKVDVFSKYLIGADLKSELKEIFEHPDTRVGVIRYLSTVTREEDSLRIPFTQDELELIKEKLFLDYVEESNQIDPIKTYRLWQFCQTNIIIDLQGRRILGESPQVYHPQMDKVMRQIIEGNIESLIPYMVGQSAYNSEKYSLLCPYPIWSLDEEEKHPAIGYFPDFIRGLDGDASPIIKEFKEFAQEWQKVGGLVPFEFKYITPKKVV
ncbi:MAG: P-loop NTPase fold protein [Porphyromonas sp.]